MLAGKVPRCYQRFAQFQGVPVVSDTPKRSLIDPAFLGRLEQLELVSKKIFQGRMKGERLSKRRGQSVEFADFRPYVVGDDLRFLDWNLFARLDKLFLRIFMEEEDLHFYILVDQSRSMDFGTPTKFHYALQLAASLGYIGLNNLDRVMVYPFADRLGQGSPPLRGRKSLPRLLGYLDALTPQGAGNLAASLRTFSIQCPGRGVVIVISDFMEKAGYEEALRYLLARNMDIYVVQILSDEEINPGLVGDLKLIDIEDEDEAEVTVSAPLLKRYRENLQNYRAALSQYCTRRGIHYLFTSNQVTFDKLILGYLRQRGLVQ